MAIVTPIPCTLLFNPALPGWTENLRSLSTISLGWSHHSLDRRIEVLDDAIGFLRHASQASPTSPTSEDQHAPLIRELEFRVRDLTSGIPGNTNPSADGKLLYEVSKTLRGIAGRQTGQATLPDALPDTLNEALNHDLERFRIITRPLNSQQAPGVLIRGPAHLITTRREGTDLMNEFGKVVAAAWSPDLEAAGVNFRSWTHPRSSGGAMEIQSFAATRGDLARKVEALAKAGFDVHTAPIPWRICPIEGRFFAAPPESIDGQRIVHWIVGRRHKAPLETWFQHFIDARDAAGSHQIERLDVFEKTSVSANDPDLMGDLHSLFGRPIRMEDIRQGFAIDVPGYVTSRVEMLRHEGSSGVELLTEITTTKGEMAARLSGWLPPAPPAGEAWIAWGEDLNEQLYGSINQKQVLRHFSQGIGRRSLTRILTFLHRLGVNALDMRARGHGLHFMPHIGFDFADSKTRENVLAAFTHFVHENDSNLSAKTEKALLHVRHAWDVCEFQNDRGEDLGRRFIEHYARVRKASVPLRFSLSGSYEGWQRLFSKQLAMRPELDIQMNEPASDPQLVDRAMRAKAEELTGSIPKIDLDLPLEVRKRLAELQETILYFRQKEEAARSSADRDDMTQLLKRRAFLDHNNALETSLTAQRKGDHINEHWALMVDIDKFKSINDTYGHGTGDEAIRLVAQILKSCIREGDLVCRWGGEEFALILRHSGREGVEKVAERIREEVEKQQFMAKGKDDRNSKRHLLTVSIGAAPFRIVPGPRKTSGEFNLYAEEPMQVKNSMTESLDAADANLYLAKENGRNRVIYTDTSMSF